MNNERGDITDTLNKCCRNLLSKIGLWGQRIFLVGKLSFKRIA